MKKLVLSIAAFVIIVAAVLTGVMVHRDSMKKVHKKKTFFRMDTVIDVTLVARKRENLDTVWAAVDNLLVDWEKRFAQTHEESEVRKLNERQSDTVVVSEELAEMIAVAHAYGDSLDGMFDLTIYPVKELWGFKETETIMKVPSATKLAMALEKVDYKRMSIDKESRTVAFADSQTVVDVGGVAKGTALVKMAEVLDRCHYHDYLVVAGGDIVAKGRRYNGANWKIGIRHPRDEDKLLAVFRIDSIAAVVTSGDYERFWMKDSVRYHHIFNPQDGQSCRKNQSLTIGCKSPVEADILSTGLFCLTHQEILEYVEARPRLECVIVDSTGQAHASRGWEDRVRWME